MLRLTRDAAAHHEAEEMKRRELVRHFWRKTQSIELTIGEIYLREVRELEIIPPVLRLLPADGPYPAAVVAPLGIGVEIGSPSTRSIFRRCRPCT